jgi:tetratricopeptide (TPR) repeat protein
MTTAEAARAMQAALAAGDPAKAEAIARNVLAGGRGELGIWALYATALRRLGRHREACTILERLVQAAPHNLALHFDLAETLLLLGDFERGWREYRFRYSLPHTTMLDRKVQKPRWEGEAIPGKTLLIYDEQGFGDTFQFLRMVAWAKERSGARVVLQIAERQASFARRMNVADQIVLRGELPPAFDRYCEMMSLPMAMGLKLSDLPGKVPYLSVDPERLEVWRKRLAGVPRPLVALVWAGRPEHFNDAARSMHLPELSGLARDGITFVSVQKGPRAGESKSPPAGMNFVDFDEQNADFEDTGAILMLSDLLISVDTSVAHLAGALGRPVWLMLSLLADWRWLLGREDSPWYAAHRIFRQQTGGDWQGVVRSMAEALEKEFKSGPALSVH